MDIVNVLVCWQWLGDVVGRIDGCSLLAGSDVHSTLRWFLYIII